MIEWIESIDHALLLAINGAHTPWLDTMMWWVSGKLFWLPLYILLFVLVYRKYSLKHAIWFTIFGLAAVGLGDWIATYGFKYNFMRYRPSHNLELGPLLHYYEIKPGDLYKGGQYGFISGHATNSTIIALMFIQQLRKYYTYITPILIFWTILVCYSRMYLGVHYPTDILGGIICGSSIAFAMYYLYKRIILKT